MTGISPVREEDFRSGRGACAVGSIDCGGVLRPETSRQPASVFWVKIAILLVLVASIAAVISARSPNSLRGTDFPDFYCAARMVLDGQGHHLYDADLQRQYQATYAGRVGPLYIHPPFEAALYLVAASLPLRRAYLLWSVLNLVVLTIGVRRLAKEALSRWDWKILLAASLTFVPVLLCLLQGQDSILLLLLVVLAFIDLRRGGAFGAGCWLGLGLFKFHLVLPMVLVLVLTQRSGRIALVKGFSLVALALAGLSAAISGFSVFTVYSKFLTHLQAQPFAGIAPQAMANLRGLTYMLLHSDQSPRAVAVVAILSTAALIKTLTGWQRIRLIADLGPVNAAQDGFDLRFCNAILFSLLVSYHLNPHDLSLLLLPISVLLHRASAKTPPLPNVKNRATLSLIAILFPPLLHVWALRAGVYAIVALPILVLFLLNGSIVRRIDAFHSTLNIHKD
jgi:hypothetical protein